MKVVLAVDGGNSKTDLALVGADGRLIAFARGPQSSPHHLGEDGCMRVLTGLVDEARAQAGPDAALAEVATLCMAGVDFPAEELVLQQRVAALEWAERTSVANDTYAVLWAGTEHGWGVGVVCGAGINCVAVAPDGRRVRFPALGDITGDLASRRGMVSGTANGAPGTMMVRGQAPMSELLGYQSRLNALTSGQGRYTIEFSHYEAVPPNMQQQLVGAFRVRDDE